MIGICVSECMLSNESGAGGKECHAFGRRPQVAPSVILTPWLLVSLGAVWEMPNSVLREVKVMAKVSAVYSSTQ